MTVAELKEVVNKLPPSSNDELVEVEFIDGRSSSGTLLVTANITKNLVGKRTIRIKADMTDDACAN